MKIKFFKREKNLSKKSLNPILYWKIAICIFFILAILSCAFGFYLFREVSKEPILSSTNDTSRTKMVKQERIDKVLQYFSTREEKSNKIINSPSPIVDPSL